jgi:hypothetical protein
MRRIQIPTQVSGHEFTRAAKAAQKSNSLLPQAETLSAVEGAAKRKKEPTIIRPRNHSLAGHSHVTWYDFSRSVSKNKKNDSCCRRPLRNAAKGQNSSSAARELRLRSASRRHGPALPGMAAAQTEGAFHMRKLMGYSKLSVSAEI